MGADQKGRCMRSERHNVVYTHVNVSIPMHMSMYTHVYTHADAHAYDMSKNMHACTDTCLCTCLCGCVWVGAAWRQKPYREPVELDELMSSRTTSMSLLAEAPSSSPYFWGWSHSLTSCGVPRHVAISSGRGHRKARNANVSQNRERHTSFRLGRLGITAARWGLRWEPPQDHAPTPKTRSRPPNRDRLWCRGRIVARPQISPIPCKGATH